MLSYKFPLYALLIVFLFSCTPKVHFNSYTSNDYKPTNDITIYKTKKPSKEYIELGELSVQVKNSNEDKYIQQLRKKGKEVGADGIILISKEQGDSQTVPIGNMYYTVNNQKVQAVAIKFK